jgi:putative transcriptional regulator
MPCFSRMSVFRGLLAVVLASSDVALAATFPSSDSSLSPAPFLVSVRTAALAASSSGTSEAPRSGAGTPARPMAPVSGVALVATDKLRQTPFARAVIILLEANEEGAVGLVINRPTRFRSGGVHKSFAGTPLGDAPAFAGGPVDTRRLFFLFRSAAGIADAQRVLPGLWVATHGEAVERAADEQWTAANWRLVFGYSGWAAGQLESEIARGDWLLARVDADELLSPSVALLWQRLFSRSGGRWARRPSVPTAEGG